MKITVYTTTDCQFSKQEREYLASHNLQYEEKNLETNKEFLTEMLAVSNNFAGTPVTRIEKDDGTITVLKGFTKEEFDTVFGFAAEVKPPVETEVKPVVETPPAPSTAEPQKTEESKPTETPPPTAEVQTSPTPPQPEETPPQPENPPPPISANPVEPTIPPVDKKLESVLDKLASPPSPADVPTIPDFSSDNQTIQSDK